MKSNLYDGLEKSLHELAIKKESIPHKESFLIPLSSLIFSSEVDNFLSIRRNYAEITRDVSVGEYC